MLAVGPAVAWSLYYLDAMALHALAISCLEKDEDSQTQLNRELS